MVSGHRAKGCPSEIVVQHIAETWLGIKADLGQRLIEAGDGPTIHLCMLAVAAVHPDNAGFVAIAS